jgi:acetamidase/formamidase
VPGGLFSVGDSHAAQGDSELCGTAIEMSLTGTFPFCTRRTSSPARLPR